MRLKRSRLWFLVPLAVPVILAGGYLATRGASSLPDFCRETPPNPELRRALVRFVQGDRQVTVRVEVADRPETRARGLMCRASLEKDAGMLFVFEEARPWSFWMKNTLIPLSIAFMDERGYILDIQAMDVEADPEHPAKIYASPGPAKYALEVNQGFFRRAGITVGARMKILPLP